MNLPAWVTKVLSFWAGIGVLLVMLGSYGINLPVGIIALFSPEAVEMLNNIASAGVAFAGTVVTFYQFVRALFLNKSVEVNILSNDAKVKYILNPFKTRLG